MDKTQKEIPKPTTYKHFDKFIVRTPVFSLQKWQNYIVEIKDGSIENLIKDEYFLEAIYIASPNLYDEIKRHKNKTLKPKEEDKLILSLVKYLSRMSWRCTPFGLFSGCTLGNIGDKNNFEINATTNIKKYTRIDMDCLCKLIKKISEDENVKNLLRYFPNNSLYNVGDKKRYIEFSYNENKRLHKISSVENTEYLSKIIENAEQGQTIENLANLIVDDDISFADAKEFIIDLIENQILESELYPSVSGNDLLMELIKKLNFVLLHSGSESIKQIVSNLTEIQNKLDEINKSSENSIEKHLEIVDILNNMGINDFKNYFQVDISKTPTNCSLDKNTVNNVWEAISFLNKLTPRYENPNLQEFKNSYYKRYESLEMPLDIVLDNEIGIGYPINQQGDSSKLLDMFNVVPANNNNAERIEWSPFQAVLHKKYLEAITAKSYEIELKEEDFPNIQTENWNDLPATISLICKVLNNDNLIYLSSCGGSSAANLLARFAHIEKSIENYILEITTKEDELQNDVILAEIVHLPEDRVGNVIFRPTIRKYEIPYLAQSSVNHEFQLPISDLSVSIQRNTVVLRSKRLNKRIIPHLSNAHNYSLSKIPAYRFLCDVQTEGLRGGFSFRWSNITNNYDFLPRVKYKNIILSFARWAVDYEDFKKMKTVAEISEWRNAKQMPRYVVLPDGDNEFFIDLDNEVSLESLQDLVKKRKQFYLQEFPFDINNLFISDNNENSYTNEFIINFYKDDNKNVYTGE